MDWSALIGLLPTLLSAVQVAENIMGDRKAASGLSVQQTIQKEAPDVVNIFTQIGAALFPAVPPAQQQAAAATALSPTLVVKIQTALNSKLPAGSKPVDVDGQYGPQTQAVVEAFQAANGLATDQWAGPLTQKALGIAS